MKLLGKVFAALVFLFIYAPLFVMVFFSFNSSRSTSVFEGFSLKWYTELFSSGETVRAIFKMRRGAFKSSVMTVTNIPMMNPDIVTGVSLMLLFVFIGRFIGTRNSLSFATILIAHITFNLPYVILNVLPKLAQTDRHLSEAALDLGATEMQAFFKVVLPAISPGILSGFLMAFTLSIDDFVISYYTTGADFVTLPLKIYAMTKKTVKPDMYALSTIIFVTVLMLLMCINLMQFKAEKKSRRAPHK